MRINKKTAEVQDAASAAEREEKGGGGLSLLGGGALEAKLPFAAQIACPDAYLGPPPNKLAIRRVVSGRAGGGNWPAYAFSGNLWLAAGC